jgi:acetyl-CoA carboxylase alpha subunit
VLRKNLAEVKALTPEERLKQRYAKFRRYGAVTEREAVAA